MCGSPTQVERMVNKKVLQVFIDSVELLDTQAVLTVLQTIEHVLKCGKGEGPANNIATHFELIGGRRKLDKFQTSGNSQIYKIAVRLQEKYYARDSENDIFGDAMMPEENAYATMEFEDFQRVGGGGNGL